VVGSKSTGTPLIVSSVSITLDDVSPVVPFNVTVLSSKTIVVGTVTVTVAVSHASVSSILQSS